MSSTLFEEEEASKPVVTIPKRASATSTSLRANRGTGRGKRDEHVGMSRRKRTSSSLLHGNGACRIV
jgi:hypothetical protein